jgi:hypothetical protein
MENPVNTQGTNGDSLTVVLPEKLLRRNLAEQSKWLNDETGDRSWAKHPTQQMAWMMNVQVERLQGER